MSTELPKAYDPALIEEKWANYWVAEKLFDVATPTGADAAKKTFVQLLPPPNVTGRLHMGHMLNQTEMDILTRWHRMLGETAVWVPGTDHAGIATQMMVERQLAAEGTTTREQLGREAFTERVWEWKHQYGNAITDQMRRLGASVDWSREYFTMDDRLSKAVKEAFVRLYEQGLIYRGAYIVNWDPVLKTAVSDLEVTHEERAGKLYHVRYPLADGTGSIVIATTRPETMLGDVAVAVNPADERYTSFVGKMLKLPLVGREIPVVADDWASPEFGTGAVKVTPAHDPNDFAIGQRHNLPQLNILDESAHVKLAGSPYDGMERYAARERIVEDLRSDGALIDVKDHTHAIALSQRTGVVIEPRLSMQWFLKIQPLADKAIEAVDKGYIKFTPDNYRKTYDEWMKNIHDWCISRQLWWGHRIPAWHCGACNKITVSLETPGACSGCGITDIRQETDVLDTWFSSGLLPFTAFGWIGGESELADTISRTAEAEGRYIQQVGGVPNYAHVRLRVSPNEPGKGFTFSNEQNVLPHDFIAPIERGIQEAMRSGVAAGRAIADVHVVLVGGSLHEKDSNEAAFQIAASLAFKEAVRKAEPITQNSSDLEPANRKNSGRVTAIDSPLPNLTADLAAFYPTTLLVTGSDILFFWVARMIMLGCHFMLDVPMPDGSKRTLAEAVPFRNVYIHALVRDADRQKMSKTKGNVVDPIEIVQKYGTDAVRFTLASQASPGTDIAFSEARTEGNRAFANKIWNAARFIAMNIERGREAGYKVSLNTSALFVVIPAGDLRSPAAATALPDSTPLETRWIFARLSAVSLEVERALTDYRFDEAANAVYQFFWGEFCDWYLELVKLRMDFFPDESGAYKPHSEVSALTLGALVSVFEAALRLLSPFMPFLTEELWHALYSSLGMDSPAKSIALTRFPQAGDFPADAASVDAMNILQELIVTVRGLRKDLGVPEKEAAPIQVFASNRIAALADANSDMLARLARVSAVELAEKAPTGNNARATSSFDVAVIYERQIDVAAERERLQKDLAKFEKGIAAAERQLGNEGFVAKAPPHIIEGLRKQYAETMALKKKAEDALGDLPAD
jgi:valyl-tRNA synthetase